MIPRVGFEADAWVPYGFGGVGGDHWGSFGHAGLDRVAYGLSHSLVVFLS
jgi:hypothetical protein